MHGLLNLCQVQVGRYRYTYTHLRRYCITYKIMIIELMKGFGSSCCWVHFSSVMAVETIFARFSVCVSFSSVNHGLLDTQH